MPTKKDDKKKKIKFKVVPRKKKEEMKEEKPKPKKKIKFKVVPKKEVEKPKPKKKIKFKVVPKKPNLEELKKKVEEQTKKDGIERKVLPTGEVLRKKTKKEPKKTAGEKLTGKTTEEMKKMNPAELFGQLPKELRQKVLDPKQTGVAVGRERIGVNAFIQQFKDLQTERNVMTDSFEKDPDAPDSYVDDVMNLYGDVQGFLSNFKGTMEYANGYASSSRNMRQLIELAKRKKRWNKPLYPGIDDETPRDIWNRNTGEFMFRIKRLQRFKLNGYK
jgi:hypothetical protein